MNMSRNIGAAAALKALRGWKAPDGERDAIQKAYKFADFKTAFAFMSGAALKASRWTTIPNGSMSTTRSR